MTKLPYNEENELLIQEFIDETKNRIHDGVEIRFTQEAADELYNLALDNNLQEEDIEYVILNLTTENYYRGIDPSHSSDYNICAFGVLIGDNNLEIYLKYGIENNGLDILIFSNHTPEYSIDYPFNI